MIHCVTGGSGDSHDDNEEVAAIAGEVNNGGGEGYHDPGFSSI